MKALPLAIVALTSALLPPQAPEPREGNRALPAKLRGIRVGILVQHRPNPCFPVAEGTAFVWRHDTAVRSLAGDLVLVEYGAYIYTDAGWRLRATMTPEEFAKAYRCPGARLREGRAYTDPDNSRRSEKPVAGDALWYFLAKDAKGGLVKGTALVETEALRDPAPVPP